MKAVRFVLAVVMMALFVFVSAGVHPAKAETNGGASLDVQVTQNFNHVTFVVTWVTDEPVETANWTFLFGDGTQTVLTGTRGSVSFSHDYEYVVGGIVTYHPSISLPSSIGGSSYWTDPWIGTVTIDDSPVQGYQVFLPLVVKPAPEAPTCFVNPVVVKSPNQIRFDYRWDGAFNQNFTTDFGDGSSTEELSGMSGQQSISHSFPWPGGTFTVSTDFVGPGGTTNCSVKLQINWP